MSSSFFNYSLTKIITLKIYFCFGKMYIMNVKVIIKNIKNECEFFSPFLCESVSFSLLSLY